LAGVGSMTYGKFLIYNVVGGLLWIFSFTLGGYFFGNLPFVKKNFTFVIFAIIIISVMPTVIEYFRQRKAAKKEVKP
jgi:membrane-associated protein